MASFTIKNGKNIKLAGGAKKETATPGLPAKVGIQPPDFRGLKPRLAVKEGDQVKVGSPVLTDKAIEGLQIVSPASGRVVAINRGDKRALLSIVIEIDGKQDKETFDIYSASQLSGLKREDVIKNLLNSGLWPVIRQRPFTKIANPKDAPKSIFVHAMSTEPLAADVDYLLEGKTADFQAGLSILKKLTDGAVNLCIDNASKSEVFTNIKDAQVHRFSGPHPTGNVGTHIHYVDPIQKGDLVWFVEAVDVARVGALFLKGTYPFEKTVAVTGEGAKNKVYVKSVEGAPVSFLAQGSDLQKVRCISGSVFSGRNVGAEGFIGFYNQQLMLLPEGGKRELLGWLTPGFNKFSFSHTYPTAFLPSENVSLTTDENGSHRAIVLNHVYDSLNTLDILTYFLLKAIYVNDIEEAEKLGILECDSEDFALCTFACPSKVDVAAIIREGLEVIEHEG